MAENDGRAALTDVREFMSAVFRFLRAALTCLFVVLTELMSGICDPDCAGPVGVVAGAVAGVVIGWRIGGVGGAIGGVLVGAAAGLVVGLFAGKLLAFGLLYGLYRLARSLWGVGK